MTSACGAGSARLCTNPFCKEFSHKLYAWRSGSSSLNATIPDGWRGPSRWELERRQISEMTEAGMNFDRPSNYSSTAKPRPD